MNIKLRADLKDAIAMSRRNHADAQRRFDLAKAEMSVAASALLTWETHRRHLESLDADCEAMSGEESHD